MCRLKWPVLVLVAVTGVALLAAARGGSESSWILALEASSPLLGGDRLGGDYRFIGQSDGLPGWSEGDYGYAFVSLQQGPTSVTDGDGKTCSVAQDGGNCSSKGGSGDRAPCSALGGKNGKCSTEGKSNATCSTSGKWSTCSAGSPSGRGGSEGGTCSAYDGHDSKCSAFNKTDQHCTAGFGKNNFCSAQGGQNNFCSVNGGDPGDDESSPNNCSTYSDKKSGATCSTKDPGDRTFCSIVKGSNGVCTTIWDDGSCSVQSGARNRCSTYDPQSGGITPPDGNGKCRGK
ncbi:MAG: hypothetical protein AB1486_17825 [Planctomycetota bacterium]